ncbi:hypothetical protein [Levilactobacillus namurensis]|uniref:hypothetical protein n=1 Tax=Levilactobacillus namurensis TaxID=380393 RepID=UPI0004B6CA8D|nr:hypothetical protein [Levilactobacillus namurensis]
MMMPTPKGLEYWVDGPNGLIIAENAPKWAKEEYQNYMVQLNAKPDEKEKLIKR